ncbi:MAG TPA: NlpC/P60 family protein [Marmoricola sp.]|nr:NlpC/P60 family protein [Marmoricola sp.]
MPALLRPFSGLRQPVAAAVALFTTVTLALVMAVTGSALVAQRADAATRVNHAISVARNQIGDPYHYGSDGPRRFDCSGLTYFAFHKRSGFGHFPRTASAQAHFARHIRKSHMRKGDLMFFYNNSGVYHVGIFTGFRNGHRMVLHSPYPGKHVHVERVWTRRWFAGTLRHR